MGIDSVSFLVLSATCLAAGSALISALETAFFSLQSVELERLRRKRARYADRLTSLLSNPRRLLSAIVLADVVLNIPLIVICLYLLRGEMVPGLPFWVKALMVLGLVVFLCDLVPKVLALLHPYRLIRVGVGVVTPLLVVFAVPARGLQRLSDWLAERLIPGSMKVGNLLQNEEVSTLVELGAEEGALHASEGAMIQQIIRLGGMTVRECMTPRVDMVCFPDDLTNEELAERLRKVYHRRVLIYGETPDEILGVLEVRAFLEGASGHYTDMVMPPSFVPETMNALDLMRSFLRLPQAVAVVVDEHGGTEGMITRADLVEEVLAEALPGGERELYIEAVGVGRFVASGNARLEDLGQMLERKLEVEGIDTVGGYVFNLAGHLPKPGEVFVADGLRFLVRRTLRKRVEEVLVEFEGNESEAGEVKEAQA